MEAGITTYTVPLITIPMGLRIPIRMGHPIITLMGAAMTTLAGAKATSMDHLMIRMVDVTMMTTNLTVPANVATIMMTLVPPTGATMTIMVLPMIHMGLPIVVTLTRMGHPTMAPLIPTRMGCLTRAMAPTTIVTAIIMAQPTITPTAHLIPLVPTS